MTMPSLASTNLSIELLRESDIEAALDIERRSNTHPWSETNFCDALRAGYLCLVARDESHIVGLAVTHLLVDDAELLLIAVNPDNRRSGCASALLSDVSARLRGLAKNALHIEVRISNVGAIAFYVARGFQRVGLRKNYYPSGVLGSQREDAVLMKVAL